MKFGLWLLIGVAAYLWFSHSRKSQARGAGARRGAAPTASATAATAANAESERMVACAGCGLHVPLSDAMVDEAGQSFCSEAHRRQHRRA